jgi:anti-anti-sigma factor
VELREVPGVLVAPRTPVNPSWHFRIDVRWSDGIATVAAHGRLDALAAPDLSARLSEIIEVVRPYRLVVDLADVTLVDRAGAMAIVAAGAELPGSGAQLVIRRIPHEAVRFFQVTSVASHTPTPS